MPVTVVVGGQFGGEGKGKVTHFLAQEMKASIAIRVGGTNSGHTVIDSSGKQIILRQLPTPAILPDIDCMLPAGSYIDIDLLFHEIALTGLSQNRLYIDPNAVIITAEDQLEEKDSSLRSSIASTLSGTGASVKKRINRTSAEILAKNCKHLKQFIKPTVLLMRESLASGKRVIIEGTQGFGLSLLHSPHFPYVTSRDTTAAAFVSEAGLSPIDVDDIVMVIRAFPIRVGGNSGPLPNECDWDSVTKEAISDVPFIELTSVTKTIRRIARFNPDIVEKAILVNQPTRIVLNHLDYVDAACCRNSHMTLKARDFIKNVELQIKRRITYIGFDASSLTKMTTKYSEVQTL